MRLQSVGIGLPGCLRRKQEARGLLAQHHQVTDGTQFQTSGQEPFQHVTRTLGIRWHVVSIRQRPCEDHRAQSPCVAGYPDRFQHIGQQLPTGRRQAGRARPGQFVDDGKLVIDWNVGEGEACSLEGLDHGDRGLATLDRVRGGRRCRHGNSKCDFLWRLQLRCRDARAQLHCCPGTGQRLARHIGLDAHLPKHCVALLIVKLHGEGHRPLNTSAVIIGQCLRKGSRRDGWRLSP